MCVGCQCAWEMRAVRGRSVCFGVAATLLGNDMIMSRDRHLHIALYSAIRFWDIARAKIGYHKIAPTRPKSVQRRLVHKMADIFQGESKGVQNALDKEGRQSFMQGRLKPSELHQKLTKGGIKAWSERFPAKFKPECGGLCVLASTSWSARGARPT